MTQPRKKSTARRLTFDGPRFRAALELVRHTAADDEARPVLATILLEGDAAGFRMVAADNYRIGIAEIHPTEGDPKRWGAVLLPIADVPLVLAMLRGYKKGLVVEAVADTHLEFTTTHHTLRLRQQYGSFPAYAKVTDLSADGFHEIALNPRFLADAGAAARRGITAKVRIRGRLDPVELLIASLDYREVVMPIRTEVAV